MNDDQLLRYSRQILLSEFGIESQQQLLNSRALIIGAGGLGSPAALYLAAAGIGALAIADDDRVDLSNLQRQLLHGTADIGQPKVISAAASITAINPDTHIIPLQTKLAGDALTEQVALADVVLDASDNFTTRFAVNSACVKQGTPLVSGAAIRMEGQVSVFRPDLGGPCYRCLYKDGDEVEQTCAENGVLAPIVGIIGSIQALEAIKVLTQVGESLQGRLLLFDGRNMEWRSLKLSQDPACPVCSG